MPHHGVQRKATGEAGGDFPGQIHTGSVLEGLRKTLRPPLPPGVCMLFSGFSSFSVWRGTPMLDAFGLFKILKYVK
jgi:hypothetical protein